MYCEFMFQSQRLTPELTILLLWCNYRTYSKTSFKFVDIHIALYKMLPALIAQMAELVDALVSGTSIERCGGSSPLLGTI